MLRLCLSRCTDFEGFRKPSGVLPLDVFLLMSLRKPGRSIVIPKPWMNVNSPMFVILRVPKFLNRKQTSSLFLGWDCKISSEMNSLLRVDRAWWWFHSMTNIIPSSEFPPKGTFQDVFPRRVIHVQFWMPFFVFRLTFLVVQVCAKTIESWTSTKSVGGNKKHFIPKAAT